jgi:hypothetical protein
MVDVFKLPESTCYTAQQPFTFMPNYLKGVYTMSREDVIQKTRVSGDFGSLDARGSEKTKLGFSSGKKLVQQPIFPVASRPSVSKAVTASRKKMVAPRRNPKSFASNNPADHPGLEDPENNPYPTRGPRPRPTPAQQGANP